MTLPWTRWRWAWLGAVLLTSSGCFSEIRWVHTCTACLESDPSQCGQSRDMFDGSSAEEARKSARIELCARLYPSPSSYGRMSPEFYQCTADPDLSANDPAPPIRMQCTQGEKRVPSKPFIVFPT